MLAEQGERVLHAQWIQDALLDELLDRRPGDLGDDCAQRVAPRIAVFEASARLELELGVSQQVLDGNLRSLWPGEERQNLVYRGVEPESV